MKLLPLMAPLACATALFQAAPAFGSVPATHLTDPFDFLEEAQNHLSSYDFYEISLEPVEEPSLYCEPYGWRFRGVAVAPVSPPAFGAGWVQFDRRKVENGCEVNFRAISTLISGEFQTSQRQLVPLLATRQSFSSLMEKASSLGQGRTSRGRAQDRRR